MLGGAVAIYSERDGSIVVNRCRRKDGSWKTITGRATVVPGNGNARLKVRFFGPSPATIDCWVGREELFLVSLAIPAGASLDLIASAENYASLYNEIVANAVRQGYSAEWIVPSPGSIRP